MCVCPVCECVCVCVCDSLHGDDIFLLFPLPQDDHELTTAHLTHFLRWTSCAHLPPVLVTSSSQPTVWGVTPFAFTPDTLPCHARVPPDWIVGLMQVCVCVRD